MALFKRDRFSAGNSKLYWQVAFWLAVAASLALGVLIWLSGVEETRNAIANGRRLIVRITDGHIEGKTESPIAREEAGEEADEIEQATASATAEKSAPKIAPAAAPTALEIAQQKAAEALLEKKDIKTATVPLAPIKQDLLEQLAVGDIPMIASDGTRPWRYYAKPFALRGAKPPIAIVIHNLGLNADTARDAINLPEEVSLSFSPYGRNVRSWAKAARAAGHEILTSLPLEPINYPASDPGPYALMLEKSMQENALRLNWVMSRMQGYIGLSMGENEAFSTKDEHFAGLVELLNIRGLMLAMPHEPVHAEIKELLKENGPPHIMANMIIDEELTEVGIQMRLKTLEKAASKNGYAVGFAHAYPITLKEIARWSAMLDEAGYTLVPLSYVTKLHMKQLTGN